MQKNNVQGSTKELEPIRYDDPFVGHNERDAERYVAWRLRQCGTGSYSSEQIKQWLGWLASKMNQDNMTGFLLEYLPPAWLSNQRLYNLLLKMVAGLIVGVRFGLPSGLLLGLAYGAGTGLGVGLTIGLGMALLVGSEGGYRGSIPIVQALYWHWRDVWLYLGIGLGIGLFFGWMAGLLNAEPGTRLLLGLVGSVSFGLLLGLGLTINYGIRLVIVANVHQHS